MEQIIYLIAVLAFFIIGSIKVGDMIGNIEKEKNQLRAVGKTISVFILIIVIVCSFIFKIEQNKRCIMEMDKLPLEIVNQYDQHQFDKNNIKRIKEMPIGYTGVIKTIYLNNQNDGYCYLNPDDCLYGHSDYHMLIERRYDGYYLIIKDDLFTLWDKKPDSFHPNQEDICKDFNIPPNFIRIKKIIYTYY